MASQITPGDNGDAVAGGEAHQHHDQCQERQYHPRGYFGERQLEVNRVERFLAGLAGQFGILGSAARGDHLTELHFGDMIIVQLMMPAMVAIDIR